MTQHNDCKMCDKPIYGSQGRVYCDSKCKALAGVIVVRIREQHIKYLEVMKMICTTCRRELVKGEVGYCSTCTERMLEDKEKRANTDNYRPCKSCRKPMKNPAPNRKWCEECSAEKKREAWVKQADAKKERRKKVKKKKEEVLKTSDPTVIVKGEINPMFLKPQGSKRRYE